jgi:hypothetical protein
LTKLKGEESYNRGSNQEHNVARLGHDPNAGQNIISPSPGYDDLKMENQLLGSQLLELEEIIANLAKENRDLKAKLGQNSSNSNWPSGKDKFKAKPEDPSPDDVSDRRQGGRPGRPLFRRETIKPEDADDIQELWSYFGGANLPSLRGRASKRLFVGQKV